MRITRRTFLRMAGLAGLSGLAVAGYAGAVEPFRLQVTRYRPQLPGWPAGQRLRIAALADIHACRPYMTPARIASIVARTNALAPDLVVLLGDYTAGHPFVTGALAEADWVAPLTGLSAPLGVHAILGNHDWWSDAAAQARGDGPVRAGLALEAAGIPVLANRAVPLGQGAGRFWLAGLEDQIPFKQPGQPRALRWSGRDDLAGTLAQVSDAAPVILLAHEPDIFPKVPARVALTLAGHTHGGQVRILGHSPVVPSRFGNRYAYGHVVEQRAAQGGGRAVIERHLIVSGGLGCSILPVRLGVPPEITVVELGADAAETG